MDGDVEFPNGNNDAWVLPTNFYKANGATPSNMGLPRDTCHAVSDAGTCVNGRFGDAVWNRALYFSVNHSGTAATVAQSWASRSTLAELSRYDVYQWELATARTGSRLAESVQSLNPQGKPVGQPVDYYSFSRPQCTAGLPASNTQKDRRIVTAAVINCTANSVQGSTDIKNVENWVDLFLVEPSIRRRDRTSADQIYVEVIGVATKPDGSNAFQYFSRNQPRLLR